MADLQQIRLMTVELGLQVQDTIAFIREQQEIARDEKQRQRDANHRAREAQIAREQELAVIPLRGERQPNQDNKNATKVPKLSCFDEIKKQIHSFLQRIEQYARANNWREDELATSLGALLTGKALH